MEFVERFLGIKKRREEKLRLDRIREAWKLISDLGIEGDLYEEPVGPDNEQSLVVKISSDQFRQLLQDQKPGEVLGVLVHASDTHRAHELYMGIKPGFYAETSAAKIDYSKEKTLFDDLYEMGYRKYQLTPTDSQGLWSWTAYRQEKTEQAELPD